MAWPIPIEALAERLGLAKQSFSALWTTYVLDDPASPVRQYFTFSEEPAVLQHFTHLRGHRNAYVGCRIGPVTGFREEGGRLLLETPNGTASLERSGAMVSVHYDERIPESREWVASTGVSRVEGRPEDELGV